MPQGWFNMWQTGAGISFERRCATQRCLHSSSVLVFFFLGNDSVQRRQNKSRDGCLTGARQPVSFCNVSPGPPGQPSLSAVIRFVESTQQPVSEEGRQSVAVAAIWRGWLGEGWWQPLCSEDRRLEPEASQCRSEDFLPLLTGGHT